MKARQMGFWLKRDLRKSNWRAVEEYITKHLGNPEKLSVCDENGKSLFAWMFENCRFELLKLLINYDCAIDAGALNNNPVLAAEFFHRVIMEKDGLPIIEKLFGCHEFNVNITHDAWPLLFLTIKHAFSATLKILLKHPLLDTKPLPKIATVWEVAVELASPTQLELLVSDKRFHASVNDVGGSVTGETPLVRLIRDENHEAIYLLMKIPGIRFDIPDRDGNCAFSRACGIHYSYNIAMKMLEMMRNTWRHSDQHIVFTLQKAVMMDNEKIIVALVNADLHWSVDVLTWALLKRKTELSEHLLTREGFHPYYEFVDSKTNTSENYVTWAIKTKRRELFNRLKKMPLFNKNAKAFHERSFITAIECSAFDIAEEYLVTYRLDPNCWDHEGKTVLHRMLAAKRPAEDLQRYIKDYGANVNAPDSNGCTILHMAVIEGIPLGPIMMLPGIDLSPCNLAGETPLHLAVKCGNSSTFYEIYRRQFGLQRLALSVQDGEGKTVLMHAAQLGLTKIIDSILMIDASSINFCDKDGNTALTLLAKFHDNVRIAKLLLDHGATVTNQHTIAANAHHQCLAEYLTNFVPIKVETIEATAPPFEEDDQDVKLVYRRLM